MPPFQSNTHPRHDDPFYVAHDNVPALAVDWGTVGDGRPEEPRFHVRIHPALADIFQISSDVVDHFLSFSKTELFVKDVEIIRNGQ